MARNKELSSETRQSILVLRNEGYSMREIANPFTEQRKLSLTRIERVESPGAQLNKRTSTLECLV